MSFNKLKMASLFVTSIFVVGMHPVLAHAQERGGDAVVCFSNDEIARTVRARINKNIESGKKTDPLTGVTTNNITSVDLLDLYEAKGSLFGSSIIQSKAPYESILKERMKLVRDKSSLYVNLLNAYTDLKNNAASSPGGVEEVDDANESINVPGNCALVQLGVQERDYDRSYNKVFTFTYNDRLFKLLDEVNKAAFLVHEMTYYCLDGKDSSSVRKIVRAIFDSDFKDVDKDDFSKLLNGTLNLDGVQITEPIELEGVKMLGFNRDSVADFGQSYYLYDSVVYPYHGASLRIKAPSYMSYSRKTMKLTAAALEKPVEVDGLKIQGVVAMYPQGQLRQIELAENATIQGFTFKAGSKIYFTEKGGIETYDAVLANDLIIGTNVLPAGTIVRIHDKKVYSFELSQGVAINFAGLRVAGQVNLGKTGTVTSATLANSQNIKGFFCEKEFSLYENGNIQVCQLVKTAVWKNLTLQGEIVFWENGVLKSGKLANTNRMSLQVGNTRIYYQIYRDLKVLEPISSAGDIELYPTGKFKQAYFVEPYQFSGRNCAGYVSDKRFGGKYGSVNYRPYPVLFNESSAGVQCTDEDNH